MKRPGNCVDAQNQGSLGEARRGLVTIGLGAAIYCVIAFASCSSLMVYEDYWSASDGPTMTGTQRLADVALGIVEWPIPLGPLGAPLNGLLAGLAFAALAYIRRS